MADGIRATPMQYPTLGLLSEKLKKAQQFAANPFGYSNPPVEMLMNLLGVPAVQQTMERIAYGEPLTTGKGMTTQVRPEAVEAAMTLLPAASTAGKAAERGAMAAGRAGERYAEKVVPQIMERGGMPASLLESMSAQTVSPLTVYHGSPAKFSKFDPTKIGSGEGAQAYGYGHYAAEKQDIAKGYQSTLTKDIVVPAQRALEKAGGDIDAAIKKASQEAQRLQSLELTPQTGAAKRDQLLSSELSKIEELNRYKQGGEWSSGNLYEIDLPDDKIAKMLDFDKPLASQSPEIQALAKQYGLLDEDHMGGDLIAAMDAKLPAGAEAMGQAGVPGIRYLDQPSRDINQNYVVNIKDFGGYDFPTLSEATAFMKSNPQYEISLIEPQKTTSNFVVFPGNEDLLTILKRNGGLLD